MHEVAENGVAAHWIYKQAPDGHARRRPQALPLGPRRCSTSWRTPRARRISSTTPSWRCTSDQVFCFSPKGDLIELPRGATPIDFAYEVHSQVGDSCVGAKVNGKIVPLRHQLENGDQVEIITARGGQPNPGWERFVVTGKARARIRRFVHARLREEHMEGGRAAIAKAFRQEGLEATEKLLEGALKPLKQPGLEELYTAVGSGSLSAAGSHARRGARAAHPAAHRRRAAAGPAARPDRRQPDARPAGPSRRARAAAMPGCRSPAWSAACPSTSPAAATRCRASASSASSPPARA